MGGTATALAQDTVTAIDGFALFAAPGRRLAGFDTKTVENPRQFWLSVTFAMSGFQTC
jgi:hypothetical protein